MKLGMLALFGGAILAMSTLTGCETLVDTPGQNWNRMAHSQDTNFKQIPEDTERLLLLYRPSWLAREPIPLN